MRVDPPAALAAFTVMVLESSLSFADLVPAPPAAVVSLHGDFQPFYPPPSMMAAAASALCNFDSYMQIFLGYFFEFKPLHPQASQLSGLSSHQLPKAGHFPC